MGLTEQAQSDFSRFTSDTVSGFAKAITFTAPNSGPVVIVNGITTKHNFEINEEGKSVNAKKASITVSESLLVAQSYPVRNESNEVNLTGHKVSWKDSNSVCQYMIREWFPDETLGLITCILGDFE